MEDVSAMPCDLSVSDWSAEFGNGDISKQWVLPGHKEGLPSNPGHLSARRGVVLCTEKEFQIF